MIELSASDVFGIIWLNPNGEIYSNQTGGYSCNHPQERGFFQPITPSMKEQMDEHFVSGPLYGGWCCDGIKDETAIFLDTLFSETKDFLDSTLSKCRVDRERLKDSMEAWVYITCGDKRGVLTWVNSD